MSFYRTLLRNHVLANLTLILVLGYLIRRPMRRTSASAAWLLLNRMQDACGCFVIQVPILASAVFRDEILTNMQIGARGGL